MQLLQYKPCNRVDTDRQQFPSPNRRRQPPNDADSNREMPRLHGATNFISPYRGATAKPARERLHFRNSEVAGPVNAGGGDRPAGAPDPSLGASRRTGPGGPRKAADGGVPLPPWPGRRPRPIPRYLRSRPLVQRAATCILSPPALDRKCSLIPARTGRFSPLPALKRTESATCSEIDFAYSALTSQKPQSGSLPGRRQTYQGASMTISSMKSLPRDNARFSMPADWSLNTGKP